MNTITSKCTIRCAFLHNTFISSVSVYASNVEPNAVEDAPIGTLDDPTVEQVTGATFGPRKALCEQAAEAAMPSGVAEGLRSSPVPLESVES